MLTTTRNTKNKLIQKEVTFIKIAIVGAGATGSVFGGYLRKGGASDLTFIDIYKAHMDKVAADGLTFTIVGGEETHFNDIKAYSNPADAGTFDVIIYITKANQLRAAIENAKCCIGPNTVGVSLINGLGNDEVMAEYFPKDHLILGSGVVGTELPEPGHCIAKPVSGVNMNFGPVVKSEAADKVCAYLLECFEKGGLTPVCYDEIMPVIWKKVIVNCCVCGCCSVTALKEGPIEEDPYGKQLYRKVAQECCAVATACGYPIDADEFVEHTLLNVIAGNANYYPSMAQDMLIYKRATEIDAMNSKISELGKQLGVPTPANDIITLIVKCVQNNYDKVYPNG